MWFTVEPRLSEPRLTERSIIRTRDLGRAYNYKLVNLIILCLFFFAVLSLIIFSTKQKACFTGKLALLACFTGSLFMISENNNNLRTSR